MKRILFMIIANTFIFATFVSANTKPFMISIDKQGVPNDQLAIESAIQALNTNISTEKGCFFNLVVSEYIPYKFDPKAPYYGVAIAKLNWQCDDFAEYLLNQIQSDLKYTIYSDGKIGPFPAVSGGN